MKSDLNLRVPEKTRCRYPSVSRRQGERRRFSPGFEPWEQLNFQDSRSHHSISSSSPSQTDLLRIGQMLDLLWNEFLRNESEKETNQLQNWFN